MATARLLPCAYDSSVKTLIHAIEALRPDALLMTGQAARRGVVCVERFARNLDDAKVPDNDGAMRRGLRISRGAPDWLETALSVRTIASAIARGGDFQRECRERRRICLQPSLLRGLAIPERKAVGDPRRLCAFAGDAGAGPARGRRERRLTPTKPQTRCGRPRGDPRPNWRTAKRRDRRAALSRRRRRGDPLPRAAARRRRKKRLPRRMARRRTSMSILPLRSLLCARSLTRFWKRPGSRR